MRFEKSTSKNIVITILTFNHPQIINEYIQSSFKQYESRNIDVWIVDSSSNNEIYNIVKGKLSRNLFYYRLPCKMHANKKLYWVYKQVANSDYDFLWVMGDAIRISDNQTDYITDNISLKYDLIQLYPGEKKNIKDYQNIKEFFEGNAWYSTLWGSTLINVNKMLKNADFSYYSEKYSKDKYVSYNHIGLIFEQLYKNVNSEVRCIEGILIGASIFKKRSTWHEKTFDIFCNDWINVIDALPEYYNEYKDKVIRDLPIKSIIPDLHKLYEMYEEEIFSEEIYNKYKKQLFRLFDWPEEMYQFIFDSNSFNEFLEKKAIYIYSKSHVEKVWLYGTGKVSKQYQELLGAIGIKICGFIETEPSSKVYNGYPIIGYDEIEVINDDEKIVLAVGIKNRAEIEKKFENDKNVLFDDKLMGDIVLGSHHEK